MAELTWKPGGEWRVRSSAEFGAGGGVVRKGDGCSAERDDVGRLELRGAGKRLMTALNRGEDMLGDMAIGGDCALDASCLEGLGTVMIVSTVRGGVPGVERAGDALRNAG